MSVRSSASVVTPVAAEVPVTAAMLAKVRVEVLERVDQVREEARADTRRLEAKIEDVRAELTTGMHGMQAQMHGMQAQMHGMQAQMARIEVLVEEQNARNKVVLDGLMAVLTRQDQLERRQDAADETLRSLAAARPAP